MAAELKSPPIADSLAMEFCDELRATLTPEQMEQAAALNAAETHPNVCHSHDFCDANMVMHEVLVRYGMDATEEDGMDPMYGPLESGVEPGQGARLSHVQARRQGRNS